MGYFETIMRASIADILTSEKRALGYGVYGLIYVITWTIESFIYAYILTVSQTVTAIYTITTSTISTFLISQI